MKNKVILFFASLMGALLAFMGVLSFQPAYGNITLNSPAPVNTYQQYTFFATTTGQTVFSTTTSAFSTSITPWRDATGRLDNGYFVVAGAKSATVYFSRGGVIQANTGSSAFSVQATDDGTNWYEYSAIQSIASTTPSWVISAATSTTVVGLDLTDKAVLGLRCRVIETTDGEHSCRASARW